MPLKEDLLAHMKWGREYSATQLTQVLRAARSTMLRLLQELVDEGQLRAIQRTVRAVHYTRVSLGCAPVTVRGSSPGLAEPTSMATFPVRRNFTGSLSCYGSELGTKRQLALLARDRCR